MVALKAKIEQRLHWDLPVADTFKDGSQGVDGQSINSAIRLT
jgi:hypothetical protein